jgi:hypothetical protein
VLLALVIFTVMTVALAIFAITMIVMTIALAIFTITMIVIAVTIIMLGFIFA